jgi:hypothetical protein
VLDCDGQTRYFSNLQFVDCNISGFNRKNTLWRVDAGSSVIIRNDFQDIDTNPFTINSLREPTATDTTSTTTAPSAAVTSSNSATASGS